MRLVTKDEIMSEEITPPVEPPVAPAISAEAYEQIKNDMHKFKRMAQESQEKEQQYLAKLKDVETNQAKSQGKYKELYESTLQEADKYKAQYTETIDSVLEDKKLSAVREFAMKHNIRKEALDDLDMIDMSGVVVETTDQGRYNVLGADSFVDKLKAVKPHWFTDATPPGVNNSTGNFDGKDKTYSPNEMLKLSKENPSLYREILTTKKHLIQRR